MNELANLVGAGEEGRRDRGRVREGREGRDREGEGGRGGRDPEHRLSDIYASQYIRNYRQETRSACFPYLLRKSTHLLRKSTYVEN